LWYLGLSDSVDVIYGSSAGALIGAYFLADQLPHEGPEIYYKLLTSAGNAFIDKKALLRSCGLGLLDLRWKSLVSLVADHLGPPALNLDFLLQEIVGRRSPLNWERFWEKQQRTPLKVVVSGLLSRRSVALSAADGHFQSLEELCRCLKASMLLPGLSGPPVQLRGRQAESPSLLHANWTERSGRFFSRGRTFFGSEPFVDAQLFEPIPLRSAERDGCSHILVLRTRADGQRLTRPMSLLERTMLRRYFSRKLGLPQLADYMLRLGHRAVYAEDVLRLNEASADLSAASASPGPKLLAVALPPGALSLNPSPSLPSSLPPSPVLFSRRDQGGGSLGVLGLRDSRECPRGIRRGPRRAGGRGRSDRPGPAHRRDDLAVLASRPAHCWSLLMRCWAPPSGALNCWRAGR
jgi:predicted acylesterase/phospholipase RssA